jgi:hypothetical protein
MTPEPFVFDRDYCERHPLKFETVYSEPEGLVRWHLAFGSIAGVCLITLVGLSVIMLSTLIRFENEGVETTATIVDCSRYQQMTSRGGSEWVLDFDYVYAVARREYKKFGIPVTETELTCADFPVDGRLRVQYLEDAPEQSRIVDTRLVEEESPLANVILLVVVVAAAVGLGWATQTNFKHVRQYRMAQEKHARLLQQGIPMLGRVRDVVVTPNQYGYLMALEYEFEVKRGRVRGMQVKMLPKSDGRKPKKVSKGTVLLILYAGRECHVVL